MSMNISEALTKLDTQNDDHWTNNGSPRMDVLQALTGDETITRKMVTDDNPNFTRDTAEVAHSTPTAPNEKGTEPVVEPAVVVTSTVVNDDGVTGDGDEVEPISIDADSILNLPLHEIFQSEDRIVMFQAATAELIQNMVKEKLALEGRIDKASALSARATTILARIKQRRPNSDTENIRDYLASQNKAREERGKRAKALIDQGFDTKLLAAHISGKSKLDLALNQRKPALGSTRPGLRAPVTVEKPAE